MLPHLAEIENQPAEMVYQTAEIANQQYSVIPAIRDTCSYPIIYNIYI